MSEAWPRFHACSGAISMRPVILSTPASKLREIRAFTLVELLLVVAIIAVLVGLLLPAVQKVRERANQIACQSNLAQIGTGLGQYSLAVGHFPAGFLSKVVDGKETGPGWGWASELLPWVEQDPLSRGINRSVSPLDPKNQEFRGARVKTYRCPSDPASEDWEIDVPVASPKPAVPGEEPEQQYQEKAEMAPSRFVGIAGTTPVDQPGNGLLFRNSRVRSRDIEDGESHTLLVTEKASWVGMAIWHGMLPGVDAKPTRFGYPGAHIRPRFEDSNEPEPRAHSAAFTLSSVLKPLDLRPQPLEGLGSWHTGGINAIFADGHLQTFTEQTSLAVLQALATRAGGEATGNE